MTSLSTALRIIGICLKTVRRRSADIREMHGCLYPWINPFVGLHSIKMRQFGAGATGVCDTISCMSLFFTHYILCILFMVIS